jgi:hypothetical protein
MAGFSVSRGHGCVRRRGNKPLTNLQLYLSIGVPMLFNAILISILMAYINAKIGTVNTRIDGVDARIAGLKENVNQRFTSLDQRFDDMRDLWRAELRRVEEVLDARLKHLEEK